MEPLNQDLAAVNSRHMRFNPKNINFIVVSRSRISAPGYGDITLGGDELEELKKACVFLE